MGCAASPLLAVPNAVLICPLKGYVSVEVSDDESE